MNLDLRDTRTSALRRARTCGSLYLRRDCRRCTEPSLLRSVRSHRGTDLPQTQQATPFMDSINEVNLRQARLVLGWVTVSGVQLPVPENLFQFSVYKQSPRLTQPSHPSVSRRSEYQPKGGDALRLGSKCRYGPYGSYVGGR